MNRKKFKISLLIFVTVLPVLFLIIVWFFSSKIINPEVRTLEEDRQKLGFKSYSDFGYDKPEEIEIVSGDLTLRGWFFKSGKQNSNCAVIAHHGFTSTRMGGLIYGSLFYPACSILVYDARAHGESDGNFITYGYYEKQDLKIVFEWLKKKTGLPASAMILIGESMGAAVILQAAGDLNPGLIIADSSYSDLTRIVEERADILYGWLASVFLDSAIMISESRAGFDFSRVSPLVSVEGLKSKVILIHSADDHYTSPLHSRDIFLAIPHDQKMVFFSDWGAKHARSLHSNEPRYRAAIKSAMTKLNFSWP